MYSHVVIIGGTGMLMDVSRTLAGRCGILTSVAGTERSLRALDQAISGFGCRHRMLALDWSRPESFVRDVAEYVCQAQEAPSLIVAWFHDDEVGPKLATALAPTRERCAFFQVRGSTAANPAAHVDSLLQGSAIRATIDYHQIILGFRIEGGKSRWLHDAEISAGVLAAIDHPRPVTIVGTVAPWSRRP